MSDPMSDPKVCHETMLVGSLINIFSFLATPDQCGMQADLPVTVKVRTGESERKPNVDYVSSLLESAGAAAVSIHGRSMEQRWVLAEGVQLLWVSRHGVMVCWCCHDPAMVCWCCG